MDEPTDETLMAAVQAGDAQAFEKLVRRHIDALYSYAYRLSRSTALAEDLVQEAWLAAWQKAHTYRRGKVRVTAWLHRIVHNRFVDWLRRDRLRYDDDQVAMAPAPRTVEEQALHEESLAWLNEALASLPLNQRAALLLRHAQGLTNPEIGRVLGISVRAVESQLSRARRALQAQRAKGETPI